MNILASKTPNQGLDNSLCCWTAGQGLVQKECLFHRHRYHITLQHTTLRPATLLVLLLLLSLLLLVLSLLSLLVAQYYYFTDTGRNCSGHPVRDLCRVMASCIYPEDQIRLFHSNSNSNSNSSSGSSSSSNNDNNNTLRTKFNVCLAVRLI